MRLNGDAIAPDRRDAVAPTRRDVGSRWVATPVRREDDPLRGMVDIHHDAGRLAP